MEIKAVRYVWEYDRCIYGGTRAFFSHYCFLCPFLKLALKVLVARQLAEGYVQTCQLKSFQPAAWAESRCVAPDQTLDKVFRLHVLALMSWWQRPIHYNHIIASPYLFTIFAKTPGAAHFVAFLSALLESASTIKWVLECRYKFIWSFGSGRNFSNRHFRFQSKFQDPPIGDQINWTNVWRTVYLAAVRVRERKSVRMLDLLTIINKATLHGG